MFQGREKVPLNVMFDIGRDIQGAKLREVRAHIAPGIILISSAILILFGISNLSQVGFSYMPGYCGNYHLLPQFRQEEDSQTGITVLKAGNMKAVRWAGGQVGRWSGGQVGRWSGGQVGTSSGIIEIILGE